MLLNSSNENINEYIRKESVFITNAISFANKNKETLSMCLSKLYDEDLKQAVSLMNILGFNINSLQKLQKSLEELKNTNDINFHYKLHNYNTSYTASFHQLFNTTSNIANIIQNLIQNTNKVAFEEISNENEIEDNNELIISEKEGMVFLPYKKKNIEKILSTGQFSTPKDVIEKYYKVPLSKYSNSASARFREGFNLMRHKEGKSFLKSVDLGLELLSRYDLNPAVISACDGIDELDIYLDYLDSNETDKFHIFNVKYEINPAIV